MINHTLTPSRLWNKFIIISIIFFILASLHCHRVEPVVLHVHLRSVFKHACVRQGLERTLTILSCDQWNAHWLAKTENIIVIQQHLSIYFHKLNYLALYFHTFSLSLFLPFLAFIFFVLFFQGKGMAKSSWWCYLEQFKSLSLYYVSSILVRFNCSWWF